MDCVLRTFRCHLCHEDLANRTTLFNHIKRHNVPSLPPQPPQVPTDKTRGTSFYRFISTTTLQNQPNLQYFLIFVCAVCNDLHRSIEQLDNHFQTHLIRPALSTTSISNTTSASSSSNTTSASSSCNTTPASSSSHTTPLLSAASGINQDLSSAPTTTTTTTTTTNKRFSNSNLVNDRIKIIKAQKTITFDTTLSSQIIPVNTPRITQADREKLSSHYIFRMQSIDNMTEDDTAIIQENQNDQRKLTSLYTHHASSLELLKQILSSCPSHIDLEDYQYPSLTDADTTQKEKAFYRMVKHVLIDFASKCFRATSIHSNHERTFFADRIIPVFSAFENHHQNIHFEWCEKTIKSLQTISFLAIDIQRTSPNFADGLGYSTVFGHMDNERVVIEASSGGENENINHTQDDVLKLIKTLTSIVILKAYQLKNARFETFKKYKAISIQVIKRKLTLSVLSMAPSKKFVFNERRSATIPITYYERYDWLQVFELLAEFELLLDEQDEIEGVLRQENAGGGAVDDETIQQVFEATNYNINGSQIIVDGSSNHGTSLDDEQS